MGYCLEALCPQSIVDNILLPIIYSMTFNITLYYGKPKLSDEIHICLRFVETSLHYFVLSLRSAISSLRSVILSLRSVILSLRSVVL